MALVAGRPRLSLRASLRLRLTCLTCLYELLKKDQTVWLDIFSLSCCMKAQRVSHSVRSNPELGKCVGKEGSNWPHIHTLVVWWSLPGDPCFLNEAVPQETPTRGTHTF